MSGPSAVARRLARERAADRCEYCRIHQAAQGAEFHVDHVTPTAAGGTDGADNLALACPTCNLLKSDHLTSADPDTGRQAPVFDPRRQNWDDHFARIGYRLAGRTPTGRATVERFELNTPRRLFIRQAKATLNLFPPEPG